jgi:hypothetical protein
MYDPEIPGKIIAVMAMEPVSITNQNVSGVSAGTRVTTQKPKIVPDKQRDDQFPASVLRLDFSHQQYDGAENQPKKQPYTISGWVNI